VGLLSSILYVGGTLPCGRFYYENIEGFFGNSFLRVSYEYVYIHLGFLAHVIDAFERWYLSSALHKFTLGRVLVSLGAHTAKESDLEIGLPRAKVVCLEEHLAFRGVRCAHDGP